MRGIVLALAFAFAWVLVTPGAGGDHAYSHRIVVQGRLVDGAGLPMPNVTVSARFVGDSFVDVCPTEPHHPMTDAWGDFSFCWHKHAVAQNVSVTVRAGNATESRALDRDLRKMVFLLQDENATTPSVAPDGWNSTFRFEGRVWYRGALDLDGVEVAGIAMTRTPVNLTISGASLQNDAPYAALTNDYGDYNATIQLDPGLAAKLTARIASNGAVASVAPDRVFHRNVLDLKLPEFGAPASGLGSFSDIPGARDPPADPRVIMGSLLAVTISFAWVARKR